MERGPRPSLRATALALAVAALGAPLAHAQIYRSVDAQGNAVFSDRPAPSTDAAVALQPQPAARAAGATSLPYALAQTRARYPVTLYSSSDCAPCDSGRQLLTQRGIPFTEKTIIDADDADALRELSGSSELPLLTIGQKQLKGYEQTSWTQYLDAAGYPGTSQLPPSWQPPAATPLTMPAAAENAAVEPAAPVQDTAEVDAIQPGVTADNPSGIRF